MGKVSHVTPNLHPPSPEVRGRGLLHFIKPTLFLLIFLAFALTACDALAPTAPTPTPTRALSGPTHAATATVDVRPPTRDPNAVIGGAGQNNPDTADIPAESNAPPVAVTAVAGMESAGGRLVQITLSDGTPQLGDLYAADADPATLILPPGVLLIAEDRAGWGDLPRRLNAAGLTVLVITPRAGATSADFITIMSAFSALNTVSPGSMGVIGAEAGADFALIGCAVDDLCDTVALLTPVSAETLVNVLPSFNPRPLLIAVGDADTAGRATADVLIAAASAESGLQALPGMERGTSLLASQPALVDLLVDWMVEKLGA